MMDEKIAKLKSYSIFIYALSDLFLVTGSKVKVFHDFFPLGFYTWFLAQTFLPYNESQGETKFCFHCFLSILWSKLEEHFKSFPHSNALVTLP